MATLFLFLGTGPLGTAPAAHAALSPPDAPPDAPAAKWGWGPVDFDGQQHCHSAEEIGENQARHHSHSGFHAGKVEDASWDEFWRKYAKYFPNPNDAANGWKPKDGHDVWAIHKNDDKFKIVTFRQRWSPDDDPHWHNHGDDDTHWWTPDADDNDNCLFSPEFTNESYAFDVRENTPADSPVGDHPVEAHDEDGDDPTYTLEGTDRASFSIDRFTGQLATRAKLDYETKVTYSVTVRARDPGGRSDTAPVTITVTDVEEPGVVTLSSQQPRVGAALTATLTDPDGDVSGVSWKWEKSSGGQDPWAVITTDTTSNSASTTYTPAAGDVGEYLRATASYTDGHGSGKSEEAVSDNAVKHPNRAPAFPSQNQKQTREVPEDTTANQPIGDPVEADDPDSDRLTYTLGGTNARSFNIVAESGQLQTRAALNFENKPSYSVTVTARDTSRESATVTVTINVTDVEEPGTVTLTAGQPRVGRQLTARLTDPDGGVSGESWQWARSDSTTQSGPYTDINGATSASYTPVAADVDKYLRATASSYTDGHGNGKSAKAKTASAVRAANSPPGFSSSQVTRNVAENTRAGQAIGTPVTATDADTGDTLTYSLGGTDGASFNIDSTNGQLKTKAALNYESKSSYTVTVTATDSSSATGSVRVTISVTDVDEPGVVTLSLSHPRVGTPLTAALTDPDGVVSSVTWSWHSSTNKSSWAAISNASASYTPVAADVGKYLRATASYTDRHRGGKSASAVAANAVLAATANRPPTFNDGTSAARSVAENTRAGQNIGDPVGATDRDTGDTLRYSLGGTDAAHFAINASTGRLQTKSPLDYERKRSYSVRVTVTDRSLASNNIPVTINVTDVNEPPTFNEGNTSARSIAENAAANTNVGSPVAATDPDGDSLTYTLGGKDAASFAIVASTGQLKTKARLNRATKASHTVTVSVRDSRDSNGSPDTATDGTITVTITVTGVNDPPVFPDQDPDAQGDQDAKTLAVAENTPPGRNIGGPSPATDADSDALTYSLGGTDARSFGIVASTGQLLTKSPLDYETRNRYRVTVTAADTSSASDTVTVNINVTNLEENGSVTLSSQQPRVGARLTATLTDPDGQVSGVSWQWWRSDTRAGTYATISRATSASYTPVGSDQGKYLKAIASYTDRHGSGKRAESAPTSPVARPRANAAPVFAANTATRSIAENTPANRNIGARVAATDPDTGTGDRLTYTLSGTDAASFGIVASSGQLRTRAALDYETKRSYSVIVTVTDTAGASDTIAVTISVTNIDVPGKPGTPSVTAASASGHSALWARWTAPGAAAVIGGYNVQYRAGTSGNWYSARSASGTSTTVSGLTPNTTYQVRVRAYNSEGRSGWSNPGQGRTDAAPIQQQRALRQPTRTPTVCTPGIGFRTGVPWSFTAAKGGEDPPDVLLEVWNRDLCAMDFRVSSGAKWLSISPASGRSEGAHQEKQIRLSADISGLDVGTHTAAVRITAPKGGNSPQSVSVSLTITRRAPPESNYCQERTVIESPDSAFRVVVPANSAPCDTGITVESLDADSQQTPVGEGVNVVRAGQVSAEAADTRINAALWALLPGDRVSACEEAGSAAVYRVVDGDSWDLLTYRCEMDEQGRVWIVLPLTSFGVYAVTLPAPSVESSAVGEVRLQTPEAAEADISPGTPSPETMASNGLASSESSTNAVEAQPTQAPKPDVVQVEVQPTPAPGPDVVHADDSPAGLWADLPPEELTLPVGETGQSPPRRLGSLGILLYILAPIVLIIALLLIMFGVRNLRGAESATP